MKHTKKHIIIAGVPRSGKSTICHKLDLKSNLQHIEADTITFAFQYSFPETGITHTDFWGLKETSKAFSKFLSAWVTNIQNSGNCKKIDYKLAIDVYHIVPEDFVKYFQKESAEIYFLGYPDIEVQEKIKQIRQFDTEYDWTIDETDESLENRIRTYIEISKWLKEECEKYNLPFINVSKNREVVLKELEDKILNNI